MKPVHEPTTPGKEDAFDKQDRPKAVLELKKIVNKSQSAVMPGQSSFMQMLQKKETAKNVWAALFKKTMKDIVEKLDDSDPRKSKITDLDAKI